MKLFKKKNNPLWDRLLIEKNMKLKTNKMKTCKDCKYYGKKNKERVAIDDIKMNCGYDGYCVGKDEFKPKKMKLNKQQKNFIKEAYNSADVNCDWKTKIKETFPDIKFKRELPETWEEYCGITQRDHRLYRCVTGILSGETYYTERNISEYEIKGETMPDKYIALYKLELLRDHYNDGEIMPQDKIVNDNESHCIWKDGSAFLTFKTPKIRNKFYKNFKDLIEQAGDLI